MKDTDGVKLLFGDEGWLLFRASGTEPLLRIYAEMPSRGETASVLEEVAFAPLQLGVGREEVNRRVEAAMRDLRIETLRNRPPHRLSGGEKRRVALASVLSLDPQVWLLDEPTSGLDPRSQSWLVEFILKLRSEGRTVIAAGGIADQPIHKHRLSHRSRAKYQTGNPANFIASHFAKQIDGPVKPIEIVTAFLRLEFAPGKFAHPHAVDMGGFHHSGINRPALFWPMFRVIRESEVHGSSFREV